MASRVFRRNLLSLDSKLVALEVAIIFGANGAPILQQWVPPANSPTGRGFYQPAPVGGADGIAEVRKLSTGDFALVLQDGYQRVKAFLPTWRNSKHVGITAPDVNPVFGELADTYPDLTSLTAERLASGHSQLATAPAPPTFTVAAASFLESWEGFTLTDSAGAQYSIVFADGGTTIYVSGNQTPATGNGWTVKTPQGTIIYSHADAAGAVSSGAYTAATVTDGAATWLVNRWRGHVLVDQVGNRFPIQSNTATVITLESVPVAPQFIAANLVGTSTGSVFTVTGGGPTVAAGAFVGYQLNDGTNTFEITANTALTATTGTITVIGSPASVVANGTVIQSSGGPVTGAYTVEQGYLPGQLYNVTGTTMVAGAPTGTGTANTFTPTAHVNWAAGMFAGMVLVDSTGTQWAITTNSTTALTVASNGTSTTPANGAFSIATVSGGGSVEFLTSARSVAVALTGAPALGTLAVTGAPAVGTLTETAANLNAALTAGDVPFGSPAPVTGAPAIGTLAVGGAPGIGTLALSSGAGVETPTDPTSGEFLLVTLLLSDSTDMG